MASPEYTLPVDMQPTLSANALRCREYYARKRDAILAQQKDYYAANQAQILANHIRYRRERGIGPRKARKSAAEVRERDRIAQQRRDKGRRRNGDPAVRRATKRRRRAAKAQAPQNDLTRAQWDAIKRHYRYRCVYCGRRPKLLTQEHLTPRAKGGSHTTTNVVPACTGCNARKGPRNVLKPVQPLLLPLTSE